jgi:hypothetical protein
MEDRAVFCVLIRFYPKRLCRWFLGSDQYDHHLGIHLVSIGCLCLFDCVLGALSLADIHFCCGKGTDICATVLVYSLEPKKKKKKDYIWTFNIMMRFILEYQKTMLARNHTDAQTNHPIIKKNEGYGSFPKSEERIIDMIVLIIYYYIVCLPNAIQWEAIFSSVDFSFFADGHGH